MSLQKVYISGVGSVLPGDPVPSDKVEQVLGPIEDAPDKVKKFQANVGPRFFANCGIETRHFAFDPATGCQTESNATLGAKAARKALEMAGLDAKDLDLIVISCPSHDHPTPPTSAFLQEQLGIEYCAEYEVHSNCAGMGKSVQLAFDALRTGRYRSALVTYPQLSVTYLKSAYFNQQAMNKTNVALRWILADGGGAVVLQTEPSSKDSASVGHELLDTYVESVGLGRKPGMTAGTGVADLLGANDTIPAMWESGNHHLWQDLTAVNEYAAPLLLESIERFLDRIHMSGSDIDHYVLSIPTWQLYKDSLPTFCQRLGIKEDQLQFRARHTGYCGGASPLLHLDEMVRSGELQSGQKAVVCSVESSKWMAAGFLVQW